MDDRLQVEIDHRLSLGCERLSVAGLARRFSELGYTLDRQSDCRCTARYLDDSRTYPCCTTGVKESDTGLSAWNIHARRDANYKAMQELRQQVFAVSRGHLLEV